MLDEQHMTSRTRTDLLVARKEEPLVAPHPPVARIHELDGLRGLLALMVVMFHLVAPFPALRLVLEAHANIIMQAWYAVDVFFLMSGFVMMHVYGKTFTAQPGWTTFWQFMRARVARLYPVHVVAMVALLLIMLPFIFRSSELYAWSGRYSAGAFIGSLLMLHSPWIDYRSWNYPAWSISAEWHAYLVFPLLVPLLARLRGKGVMIAACLCVLLPYVLYQQDLQPDQYPTNGWLVMLRVLPLFFCGMCLYTLNPVRWLAGNVAATLVVVASLALLCLDATAPLAVLLAPGLVLATLGGNWLQALMRRPSLLFLGKISYSMYMTHALIETLMQLLVKALHRFAGIDPQSAWGLGAALWTCSIMMAVALGYGTWRFVEEPGRRWVLARVKSV